MLCGLILSGGKSSRMGHDKGAIDYHGKPQREFLFHLLNKFCSEVYVSCKKNQEVPTQLNPIHDEYEIDSPLNGILSAFKKNPGAAWLVIAVDMPLLSEDAIKFLITRRDEKRTATCFRDSDGKFPEPLFTLFEPQAYPALMKFYQSGKMSPRQFLMENDISLLQIPDKSILTNVNSLQELEEFRKKTGSQKK